MLNTAGAKHNNNMMQQQKHAAEGVASKCYMHLYELARESARGGKEGEGERNRILPRGALCIYSRRSAHWLSSLMPCTTASATRACIALRALRWQARA